MSSIVQTFSVTNKWVFGSFCSLLLSLETQPDASMTRVLPKDGGRERQNERDVRRAGYHRDAGP